jgi:hypothetical protein
VGALEVVEVNRRVQLALEAAVADLAESARTPAASTHQATSVVALDVTFVCGQPDLIRLCLTLRAASVWVKTGLPNSLPLSVSKRTLKALRGACGVRNLDRTPAAGHRPSLHRPAERQTPP